MLGQLKTRLSSLWRYAVETVVQPLPRELYACDLCRNTRCTMREWVVCEKRIAHVAYLEAIQEKEHS
jgi:hypothetical protein